jgi:hypothetical protein
MAWWFLGNNWHEQPALCCQRITGLYEFHERSCHEFMFMAYYEYATFVWTVFDPLYKVETYVFVEMSMGKHEPNSNTLEDIQNGCIKLNSIKQIHWFERRYVQRCWHDVHIGYSSSLSFTSTKNTYKGQK